MAEAKKAAAKKSTKKAAVKKQSPLEALREAIEAARKAGLVVKAVATENTDEGGTTVNF